MGLTSQGQFNYGRFPGSRSLPSLAFVVKASRPGLWATAVWFYLLPVARQNVWASWEFWVGLFYFTFPFGLLLYGWNDLGDRETDRINPRKGNFVFGAQGSDHELARLPLVIALVQIPFLAFFVWRTGLRTTALWFAALLLANTLYNTRPFSFKSRPPLELVNQAGYLLVFVMGSRVNHAPDLPWQTLAFGTLFAMHAHLFGQIMDIAPDALAGRRTTAVLLGPVCSKLLLVFLLWAESAFLVGAFHNYLVALALTGAGFYFLADALIFVKTRYYSPRELAIFALGLNLGAIGSIPWVWASGSLTFLP